MTFDHPGTFIVFGSHIDRQPHAVLGQHTPASTAWVRTFVVADNIGTAVAWLESVHLIRPIETLAETDRADWTAQAVGRHARLTRPRPFEALIYLAVAIVDDQSRPLMFQLNDELTGLVELGYVGFDAGPRILPNPDAFTRDDQVIPLTTVKE